MLLSDEDGFKLEDYPLVTRGIFAHELNLCDDKMNSIMPKSLGLSMAIAWKTKTENFTLLNYEFYSESFLCYSNIICKAGKCKET